MTPGFQQTTLEVRTGDGLDDVLLEPLNFVRADLTLLRAPAGSPTDGMSVPRCLQNIIPATGGDWFSAVLHDAAYRNWLEENWGVWCQANFTRKQCDDLMLEALELQGVGWLMRHVIFWALRLFGGAAFKKDRRRL